MRQSIIAGPLPDGSALHGCSPRCRISGLHLIAVRRLRPEEEGK